MSLCCQMTAPVFIGDIASVITIGTGGPDPVSGIVISAEGCGCGYSDAYASYIPVYCDATQGGLYPFAESTSTSYTVEELPPDADLIIDAVEGTVRLMQGMQQIAGLDALSFEGLFEWIRASRGGCVSICVDGSGAALNPDTTVKIESYVREL